MKAMTEYTDIANELIWMAEQYSSWEHRIPGAPEEEPQSVRVHAELLKALRLAGVLATRVLEEAGCADAGGG